MPNIREHDTNTCGNTTVPLLPVAGWSSCTQPHHLLEAPKIGNSTTVSPKKKPPRNKPRVWRRASAPEGVVHAGSNPPALPPPPIPETNQHTRRAICFFALNCAKNECMQQHYRAPPYRSRVGVAVLNRTIWSKIQETCHGTTSCTGRTC